VSLWRQLFIGARALAAPTAAQRDVADEVRHYLEEAAAERQATGLSAHEARRAVHVDLGSATAIEEQIRDAGWEAAIARTFETVSQDLRFCLRSLRRAPVVALGIVATIAIGIGATTATFAVLNAVLIRPLPYPDPDRLISLSHAAPGASTDDVESAPFLYFTERDAKQIFDGVGLWAIGATTVTGLGEPEQVRQVLVTHEILPTLGIAPLLGRAFSAEEDRPESRPTVILMHGYWQRRFASDPSVIGQTLTMDGQPREIVGVMPRSFRFLDFQVDAISSYQLRRADVTVGNYFRSSIARLRPGVTLDAASAEIARLIPVAQHSFPLRPGITREQMESTRLRPNLKPLKAEVIGDVGTTLWVLMTTVGIVLLIACANVANLQLVRAEERLRELSIRAALGAGARRLARQLFTESIVLSIAGGVAGTAVAYGVLHLVAQLVSGDLPRLEEVAIDSTVLWFACALTLAVALFFGAMPAVCYGGGPRLAAGLRQGGWVVGGSRERVRTLGFLVTVQIALALILMIGGGLMFRTFQRLTRVEPGFTRGDQLQTVRIEMPPQMSSSPDAVVRLQQRILDRLATLPGVAAVAYATSLPMDGGSAVDVVTPEGRVRAAGARQQLRDFRFISPGLFTSMGTPLIAGRDLDWKDVYELRPVVLVSESLARREWGGAAQAVGKRFMTSSSPNRWREIVGVVADVRERGVSRPAADMVYEPILERIRNTPRSAWGSVAYVIRSDRAGTPMFLSEIRRAVWSVDPTLPLARLRTMGDIVDTSLARTTLTLLTLSVAGGMALVLGVIGIYGVIASVVSQRTREVGLRIVLGADGGEVRRLFARQGMVLTSVGIVAGLAAAAALTRGMSSLLFEVRPLDPATYAFVTAVLVITSALAVYVPARRATRINPVAALRAE